MITIHFVLVIVALLAFLLAVINTPARINLIALGLFLWLLSAVVH